MGCALFWVAAGCDGSGESAGATIPDGAVGDAAWAPDGSDATAPGGPDASDAPPLGEPGEDCARVGLRPGDHSFDLEHDGSRRSYHAHVPPSYDGSRPVPLVLDFHGYTSDASQQMWLSGMNDKADDEGFIAVHAEGFGSVQSWNGGACCGTAADMDLDDVGLVRAIVDDMADTACIDRRRVYATGMSNGGFLSHRLACEAADVIAAIAPVAGVLGIPEDDCEPSRAIPVLHVHGTADGLVPYEGGGMFRSVPDTFVGWSRRNGCTDAPEETWAEGNAHCESYRECDDGVEVTLCTVEGGGHWWPGGPGSPSALSATDHMWSMFERFEMPED